MMHPRRPFFYLALTLLLLCSGERATAQFAAPPTQAAPSGFPGMFHEGTTSQPPVASPDARPSRDVVYLGNGRTAALGEASQVTHNVRVTGYAFAPHGPRVAVVGCQTVGNKTVPTLWLYNSETGARRLVSVPTMAAKLGDTPEPLVLEGWDGSGRFLLVAQNAPGTIPPLVRKYQKDASDTSLSPQIGDWLQFYSGRNTDTHLFRVDTGVSPIKVSRVQIPGMALFLSGGKINLWSPSRQRLLLRVMPTNPDDVELLDTYLLYNVAQDKTRRVLLPSCNWSWYDESTLLNSARVARSIHNTLLSLDTGVDTPVSYIIPRPSFPQPSRCPRDRFLWVYTPLVQIPVRPGKLFAPMRVLWLSVDGAYSLLGQAFAGVAPGVDNPQVAWTADGSRFGFVAHGDLFLQSVIFRPATMEECQTGGDILSDTEQEILAMQTLHRIDTLLHPSLDQIITLGGSPQEYLPFAVPDLPPDVPSIIDGHPFVYHSPDGSFGYPAHVSPDTVVGEFGLSRVTVTLYGDGRVISLPRLIPLPPTPYAPHGGVVN